MVHTANLIQLKQKVNRLLFVVMCCCFFLSQKEVILALPKLIKLNPIVVKEVFNRLLGTQHSKSHSYLPLLYARSACEAVEGFHSCIFFLYFMDPQIALADNSLTFE